MMGEFWPKRAISQDVLDGKIILPAAVWSFRDSARATSLRPTPSEHRLSLEEYARLSPPRRVSACRRRRGGSVRGMDDTWKRGRVGKCPTAGSKRDAGCRRP